MIFKHSKSKNSSKIEILNFFTLNWPHFAYLYHPHKYLVVVKWCRTTRTIMICNMEHIQSAKVEKIDQDFIFKNRRKMTKSGSLVNQCEGKTKKNAKNR